MASSLGTILSFVPASSFLRGAGTKTSSHQDRGKGRYHMLLIQSMGCHGCMYSQHLVVGTVVVNVQCSILLLHVYIDGVWVSVYQQAGGDVQGHCSLQYHHGEIQGVPSDQLSTCT